MLLHQLLLLLLLLCHLALDLLQKLLLLLLSLCQEIISSTLPVKRERGSTRKRGGYLESLDLLLLLLLLLLKLYRTSELLHLHLQLERRCSLLAVHSPRSVRNQTSRAKKRRGVRELTKAQFRGGVT